MRHQIWGSLCNFRFKNFCLSNVVQSCQNRDRTINIILAIASSGSIAAWAFWQQYPLLWSAIICISQVITVVKPYFPYSKYVKEINAKCLKLEILNLEFEKLWFKMQYNKISDDQAAENYFDLKKQASEILSFSDDVVFNVSNSTLEKANRRMEIFLKTEYNINRRYHRDSNIQ